MSGRIGKRGKIRQLRMRMVHDEQAPSRFYYFNGSSAAADFASLTKVMNSAR
jgi:hypothetical protein